MLIVQCSIQFVRSRRWRIELHILHIELQLENFYYDAIISWWDSAHRILITSVIIIVRIPMHFIYSFCRFVGSNNYILPSDMYNFIDSATMLSSSKNFAHYVGSMLRHAFSIVMNSKFCLPHRSHTCFVISFFFPRRFIDTYVLLIVRENKKLERIPSENVRLLCCCLCTSDSSQIIIEIDCFRKKETLPADSLAIRDSVYVDVSVCVLQLDHILIAAKTQMTT